MSSFRKSVIRVSAVLLREADGRVLTVRKRGTELFMLPGGKPEAEETSLETALRETQEEIGIGLAAEELIWLGEFSAAAANEPGQRVVADVYASSAEGATPWVAGQIAPAAEIEEIRWSSPAELLNREDIAPLLQESIAPVLMGSAEAGIWRRR